MIASLNVQKSISRQSLGMISTPFQLKKPRLDRWNHQNCTNTSKIYQNQPKYLLEIVKSDPRLKKSTLCRSLDAWLVARRPAYLVHQPSWARKSNPTKQLKSKVTNFLAGP